MSFKEISYKTKNLAQVNPFGKMGLNIQDIGKTIKKKDLDCLLMKNKDFLAHSEEKFQMDSAPVFGCRMVTNMKVSGKTVKEPVQAGLCGSKNSALILDNFGKI